MTGVELLPLVCVRCQAEIPAQVDEVVWVCEQCGQGNLLSDEKACTALDAHYSGEIPVDTAGKPFWVASGQVALERKIYGGGDRSKEAYQFWGTPHQFLIPAFSAPLDQVIQMGKQYLYRPPVLTPGNRAKFSPVILLPEDVFPMAEFVVMAIEAERKDKVREIQFQLTLQPPALWILA